MQAVQAAIDGFLAGQRGLLSDIGGELDPVLSMARTFLGGGKRLRPAFCLWGHVAGGGEAGGDGVLEAAASLDLLHVSALVHDDLMDGSATRRGVPSAHRQFEALHGEQDWCGSAEGFGLAGSVLLGDVLLMWSTEMLAGATARLGPPGDERIRTSRRLAERMRTEVTCGQYLDVVAQASPAVDDPQTAVDRAHRVVEYKAARYTVMRPLQIGAALAGAGEGVHDALATYGSHVGRAFQFRDDVLGVFGDEQVTGKPAGDDLREGKRTLLLAEARARLDGAALARLDVLVGDPALDEDGLAEARALIESSGARRRLDELIAEHGEHGLAALERADLTPDGRTALSALADAALRRDH
ncbi:polyprenyl synthetase family protein [Desertihabitans brevis]|uniref:Polyprenyl synthetase family protein n=1 Tax=Desertihabitans brevis TaxID=2268447 RepID=A0A367YS06_9ACTN|nr:polyprenyl synthetase family protein [Desertihabitans brevis]RCK68675.1 polyprenyl synthetase family protein [Desertihabitans brevis]